MPRIFADGAGYARIEKAAGSDAELLQLYTEICDLRERRHELAHSVGMVASDGRGHKTWQPGVTFAGGAWYSGMSW
jgi:hypothetical protein